MAGADDVVKAALKLIAGGAKEAGPSVAERAAKNIDVFNTANRLGVDTNDIAKLQETKRLMDYHKGFMGNVQERAKSANEIVQQMKASGAFPMEIGTRYTTEHSRRTGQGPWTVTNYYVDPKNPQGSYGYYVRRELPDGGYEESISKIRDPKLEAMHGPEKWEELQRGFIPMTGPKVVKASGGSIREGYGPGGWVDDVVKMAGKVISGEGDNVTRLSDVRSAREADALIKKIKSAVNLVKSGHFQAGRQALINQKSLDLHKSGMLPLQQGTIVTPPSTWNMPGDWRVSGYWYDEKDPRRFGYRLQNESGQTYDAAASDPRAGLRRDNPYTFGAGFKAYAGPNAAPPKPVVAPVEKPSAPKPPEVLDAINKEYEGLFGSEDPFKTKAHGGRIAKGPGGWLDDVVKMAGKVISGEGEDAAKAGIRAFHGSPHDFDRFDMSKIGTGEGAQAYGHGLYFATNEEVAKSYRDDLSRYKWDIDGPHELSDDLASKGIDPRVIQTARTTLDQVSNDVEEALHSLDRTAQYTGSEIARQSADLIRSLRPSSMPPGGRMYEVNINADPATFLDWDKPLSEQGGVDRFAKLPEFARPLDAEEAENLIGQRLHQRLANKLGEGGASSTLREAGIPGIKYLDAGSRSAGDGTRNYVVFDDKLISIIRKYGIAGASAMLGYNLMEQLDPKQALAASMADQDYQASRPQRSMGGNNSISGALNVARGLNGVK